MLYGDDNENTSDVYDGDNNNNSSNTHNNTYCQQCAWS